MLQLIKYDAACRLLAEASSIDEVKEIRNRAEAMRAYARQAENTQLERDAQAIKQRAKRKLGEKLIEHKETTGFAQGRRTDLENDKSNLVDPPRLSSDPATPATLPEMGITRDLSAESQKLARMPTEEFEEHIEELRNPPQYSGNIKYGPDEIAASSAAQHKVLGKKPKKELKAPEPGASLPVKLVYWCRREIERTKRNERAPGVNPFEQQVIRRTHHNVIDRIGELKAVERQRNSG